MTKLEELTALLVNEINDFKIEVEKLENIKNQINNTKIKMDLIEYKSIIEAHQKDMSLHLESINRFERRFENQIKQAKIYPVWAVVVFIVSILFGVISVVYVLLDK
ncbi:DUF6730 family protein [Wocania ichthyoenteri]|uniref:DUF6730 family protein n=1 Tax=Wocania ichthyoenteri TaxID=1230531 RepID=UPI00053D9418|nr:DUF6730 family protein [Wocania ichthyoenteri]